MTGATLGGNHSGGHRMFSLFKKTRERKARLDEIEATLEASQRQVEENRPRVRQLSAWLEARKISNGFGEDFEWTLATPRNRQG